MYFFLRLPVFVCPDIFISDGAAFMWPEPMPYLPQLFWRRLCSFHTSPHRNGTRMLRLHRPDTLWPWRSAVSAASWNETQTQMFKSTESSQASSAAPGRTVSVTTVVHIVKHSWLLRGTNTAAGTVWALVKMSAKTAQQRFCGRLIYSQQRRQWQNQGADHNKDTKQVVKLKKGPGKIKA